MTGEELSANTSPLGGIYRPCPSNVSNGVTQPVACWRTDFLAKIPVRRCRESSISLVPD